MDIAARIAFVQAQAVCALAEIEGMKAENQHRLSLGESVVYGEEAFAAVPDKYQIGWNSVISYLRE